MVPTLRVVFYKVEILPVFLRLKRYIGVKILGNGVYCARNDTLGYQLYSGTSFTVQFRGFQVKWGKVVPVLFNKLNAKMGLPWESTPLIIVPPTDWWLPYASGCIGGGAVNLDSPEGYLQDEAQEALVVVYNSGSSSGCDFGSSCDLYVAFRECTSPVICHDWRLLPPLAEIPDNQNTANWNWGTIFWDGGSADHFEFELRDCDGFFGIGDDVRSDTHFFYWPNSSLPVPVDESAFGGGSVHLTVSRLNSLTPGVFSEYLSIDAGQSLYFVAPFSSEALNFGKRMKLYVYPSQGSVYSINQAASKQFVLKLLVVGTSNQTILADCVHQVVATAVNQHLHFGLQFLFRDGHALCSLLGFLHLAIPSGRTSVSLQYISPATSPLMIGRSFMCLFLGCLRLLFHR